VEAFHESCDMLIIHPKTCIDCGACIPACPMQAIYAQEDLPKPLRRFKRLNAKNAIQCPLAKE
jgi:Fe-S-cluster-containing hydrogenase component 2